MLHPFIQEKIPLINKVFKAHKVKSVFVFGSALGDKFSQESDIDLLINFEDGLEPSEIGKIWWELHDNLRDVFNREVDLLIENSLKNPYFIEDINEKKQLIYAT